VNKIFYRESIFFSTALGSMTFRILWLSSSDVAAFLPSLVPLQLKVINSYNHRMVWAGSDLTDHLVATPHLFTCKALGSLQVENSVPIYYKAVTGKGLLISS